MKAQEFDLLVERACAKIPRQFRKRLANVAFVVEAEPSAEQLRAGRVAPGHTLLGLYRGRPLTHRSVSDSFVMPDQIVIFQREDAFIRVRSAYGGLNFERMI